VILTPFFLIFPLSLVREYLIPYALPSHDLFDKSFAASQGYTKMRYSNSCLIDALPLNDSNKIVFRKEDPKLIKIASD
jgi:hypothetical protein